MSAFENSAFEEVTEVKWSHKGEIIWYDLLPYKKRKRYEGCTHTVEVAGEHIKKAAICKSWREASGANCWHFDPGHPGFKTWENKLLLFKPPSHGILLR